MQQQLDFPKKWVFPDIIPVGCSLGGICAIVENGSPWPIAYLPEDRVSVANFLHELEHFCLKYPLISSVKIFWADKSDNIYFSNFIPITFFHV